MKVTADTVKVLNEVLKVTADTVKTHGGHVLSYVFDGVYVMSEDLAKLFSSTASTVYAQTGVRLALKDFEGTIVDTFSPPPQPSTPKRAADLCLDNRSPKRRAAC